MELYIDGGCSGNSQRDLTQRRMAAVVTDHEGLVLCEDVRQGGSNNIAELWALTLALHWTLQAKVPKVLIWTDSRNTQAWAKCKRVGPTVNDRAAVMELQNWIKNLPPRFEWSLKWLPRAQNKAGWILEQRGL